MTTAHRGQWAALKLEGQLTLTSAVNYATVRNRKNESLGECAIRFREQHGFFARERALHWASFFEAYDDFVLSVFYRMVHQIIDAEITLHALPCDQRRTRIGSHSWDERLYPTPD